MPGLRCRSRRWRRLTITALYHALCSSVVHEAELVTVVVSPSTAIPGGAPPPPGSTRRFVAPRRGPENTPGLRCQSWRWQRLTIPALYHALCSSVVHEAELVMVDVSPSTAISAGASLAPGSTRRFVAPRRGPENTPGLRCRRPPTANHSSIASHSLLISCA
jgi:hypothetical protein